MNDIKKHPVKLIGYNFIPDEFLPKGKDEYHLRHIQNRNGIQYRQLSAYEIEVLVRNNNTSDDWNKLLVSDAFDPELVKNCKFFGLVRIGKLESFFLEYHAIRLPVGLYNSTIISCDFGDNVVINNVNYLSHYIIGNEVIIANVNELATSNYSKFGNGIIKDGEDEANRIWVEVCNENAGRKIIPFNGMLPGDAHLWARYRDNNELMENFKNFTAKSFDKQRGYYGKIGDRTIIKNCAIMKDVWIGSDAYIKGANKLKNLTINSSPDATSQIGEGCELVNGIVGFGCRIFYGVKAVRFVMASHSQLKYGARLINSYLGNNSTISCCEVLNSLIFPSHEQHHNNSFLCAALVMGQSNMAAGATIGSNHNSRAADGEIVAARGFWPGLCVSLKHNSKFATFTLIAKGDYSAELNIPIPFSLVNNDVSNNCLVVIPAYWQMYNMYALARNATKYNERDKRIEKTQLIEFDFLAPDSINEIFDGMKLMKEFTGKAYAHKTGQKIKETDYVATGEKLLESKDFMVNELVIEAEGFENSRRPTILQKTLPSYHIFKNMIIFYGMSQILEHIRQHKTTSLNNLLKEMPAKPVRNKWHNIGGQLIPENAVNTLLKDITTGKIKSWQQVHAFYKKQSEAYSLQKMHHAFASLSEILKLDKKRFDNKVFADLLKQAIAIKEWMVQGIYDSRSKDYHNEFRKMIYNNQEEMDNVLGKLDDNAFIASQKEELEIFKKQVAEVKRKFKLK
jgi:NDP-sugar pyrophosphorylase family protein